MTEQNWATEEAYRWLANDEDAYNEIMSYPQDQRRYPVQDILEDWVGRGAMGNFTEDDFKQVNLDALVTDFADPVEDEGGSRYDHTCNQCAFLGRSGEYDVYHHPGDRNEYVYVSGKNDAHLLKPKQANELHNALQMAKKYMKEQYGYD